MDTVCPYCKEHKSRSLIEASRTIQEQKKQIEQLQSELMMKKVLIGNLLLKINIVNKHDLAKN